ncbi:helix-turn-helix domain-containing protein [Mesorhizobium argentiipisi]|uniref:Helix-turn-helix domain-containing protein n=1 Tax=Mesorhizobium argentiipisi TaxID=3015175 RepID=A0ABU8KMT4_9HYPH
MGFSYSTTELARAHKVQYWQDAVCAHMIPADAIARDPWGFEAWLSGHHVGDLTICEMKAPTHTFSRSEQMLRRRPDEDFVLVYVEAGENGFEQSGRSSLGGAGTITLLDAARPFLHDFRASRIYTVKIPRQRLLARFPGAERLTGFNLNLRAPTTLLPALISEASAFADDQGRDSAQQRFSSIFVEAVALSLEMFAGDCPLSASSHREDLFRKATDFIEENLGDSDLDVQAVADAVYVSPRTLSRLFAARSVTVMQYVWTRRLEKSHRILSDGLARNVTHAAFETGFSDLSHFTKVFKKKYGVSPRVVTQARGCRQS